MAGFKLNRPDGSVAIDSNYFNLALRQKGSLVLSSVPNPNTPGFKTGTMTVAGDQAIIAYRCEQPVAMYSARKVGGAFEFIFGGTNTSGSINVDWWLFDLPQYALQFASGGKMIVRRPTDGAVVFDSRNKYLKVMDFVEYSSTVFMRKSYPRLPAVVMNNRGWSDSATPINGGNNILVRLDSSMAYTQGNDALFGGEITNMHIEYSDYPQHAFSGGKPDYLVVDVQDY
ncbi:hypothetical protein IV505_14980 [Pseudomonas fulva]|nr:hypothetical protein [Pseudomonas fulva]MBF8781019.1 hypothetical protein [Pseudomonas fulva]